MAPQVRPGTPQPTDPADRLDRAWAATRPADPSPELLDALWARASAELDRIELARATPAPDVAPAVIPPDARRARRRPLIAWAALAQAAAILVAVGVVRSRPAAEPAPVAVVAAPRPVEPTRPAEPAASPIRSVVVGDGQIAFVRIDDGGRQQVDYLAEAPMFPTMAEHTAHDVFNGAESMVP